MAFIPVPGGIELRLKWSINGGFTYNILVVDKGGTITITDLTDAIHVITNWFTTNSIGGFFSNQASLVEVAAKDLSVANGIYEIAALSGYDGTAAFDPISLNSALVASWRTAFSGRSYRGRNYFAGFPENVSDGRNVTVGLATAWLTVMQALANDFTTAGMPLSVCSRYHLNAPRVAGIMTHVDSVVVNTGLDTQRRRLAQ